MSPAFLAAVGETCPDASVTVDWFHVVQLFTRALDEVRKSAARLVKMPTAVRWAVLKAKEKNLTAKQEAALAELEDSGLLTGIAWQIKDKFRWVRIIPNLQAVRWTLSHLISTTLKKGNYGLRVAQVLNRTSDK